MLINTLANSLLINMLKTPLNQRFATYEDLFTEFAAPILFRQGGSWDDVYYLYSPFKGLCPTKGLILSGINMHYATNSQHKRFQAVLDTIADQVTKGILNFYALKDEELEQLAKNKDNIKLLTIKTLNSASANTNSKLRVSIINCMRYINESIIAHLEIFENYGHIIADLDFMIDESKFGTDNSISLNIGFKRLTDTTKRISLHIPNINTLTISGLAAVYSETVVKGNFDAVYSVYKFNNYSVVDNSGVHKSNSLVRLCDITQTGIFELITLNEGPNRVYDYNEYTAFNDTTETQLMCENPVLFKIDSKYFHNSYPLSFQLTSVQITEMVDDKLSYNSALTQEAILQYKKYVSAKDALLFQPVQKLTKLATTIKVEDIPSRNDGGDIEIPEGSVTINPDSGISTAAAVPQPDDGYLVIQPQQPDREDPASGSSTSWGATEEQVHRPGFGVNGSNVVDNTDKWVLQNIEGLQYDLPTDSTSTTETTTSDSGTYTKYDVPTLNNKFSDTLLNSVTKSLDDSPGLILADRWKSSLTVGTLVPTVLSDIKFNQSSLLMSTIGAGITPYLDGSEVTSYITVNSDVQADMYEKYAACFTTPNKQVSKRSALFTFTQNESGLLETIMITQLGSPLIIDAYIEYPIYFKYNKTIHKPELYKWEFNGWFLNSIVNNNHGTEDANGSTNWFPYMDLLFLSNTRSISGSVKALQEQFIIEPIIGEHHTSDENDWYARRNSNMHCRFKIYFNSYSKNIPTMLTYLVLRLYVNNAAIWEGTKKSDPPRLELTEQFNRSGGIELMHPSLREYFTYDSSKGEYQLSPTIDVNKIEDFDIMHHPRIRVNYTYDGQILWSDITAGILTDDKCRIGPEDPDTSEESNTVSQEMMNWLSRKQSDLPIMDIHAWDQNNMQFLCLYTMKNKADDMTVWDRPYVVRTTKK